VRKAFLKCSLLKARLKERVRDFLLHHYLPQISKSCPYLYYQPLPSNIFQIKTFFHFSYQPNTSSYHFQNRDQKSKEQKKTKQPSESKESDLEEKTLNGF
jgi:hypothetical protein